MDRKIKTRQVHKDIKVLDKTVTVTDHVKHSYVCLLYTSDAADEL